MKVENSQGKIFHGMHFYPGVAEYNPPKEKAYRVFVNENTIRQMSPTFAGKPIFVEHVDDVEENVDELRKEADGWVIESFFNEADGKHWAKFIIVSQKGEEAIRRGYRLSNAYFPKKLAGGGLWNGVSYQKEVTEAEYEHLAIVNNPRYEESVIMTPNEFKAYCETQKLELKRLANSKDKGEPKMKALNFFKKTKVENSTDLENTVVTLPKSGKDMTIAQIVNDHDAILNMQGYANGDHMVKVGEEEMSVNDLTGKYIEMCNAMKEAKENKEDVIEEDEKGLAKKEEESEIENEDDQDEVMENEEDDEKKKEKKEISNKLTLQMH